ncbi:hypothetical protein EU508_00525 [Pseudoalteromonas fuliginea]|uniref:DUF3102 domain-containing protein n=1 Tax=Pseudoalteromonas fuliginea TaxID=1872678 RepID=A0AB73BME7_9GAMM|nr:hypothetical protein [Pseudoalteromonas fuliginea]KAA1165771.1 hypothetical protein EU508_00525 [Pseudoalteromonas fuliginea]
MAKNDLVDITPAQEKAIVQGKDILASKQDVLLKLGQAQAFNFAAKLLTVSELKILNEIKESKAYKGLTYTDSDGKLLTVSNWGECCKSILGSSQQHVDEKLNNLHRFGEEFFEQAQQMKLGYRDLRALRQLSNDEQALVIESEAVEVGDKEAVKDLIEELKAKHKKETATLKEELHASDAMLRANRELSSKNAVEMQNIKEQLHQKKFSPNKWQNDVRDFFTNLHKVHNQMHESLNQVMSLHEQLQFVDMDDRAKDACIAAFYADNKLLVEQMALSWNTIENHWGHFQASAKPSGEFLAELGFDNAEDL